MQLTQIQNQKSQIENPADAVPVCDLSDLPVGLGRAFRIADKTISVFRTRSGKLFATDNRCPHKGGPLSEGMLAGESVVCPLHQFRYDMTSGACDQEGACPVATYPVTLVGTTVHVTL
jgi:nitrite reductase (NADH) small subunit